MMRLLSTLLLGRYFTAAANIPTLQGSRKSSSMSIVTVLAGTCGYCAAVRGKLMCGKVPLAGAKLKLIDIDIRPDIDDLLAENYTDASGDFELNGATRELSVIDVAMKIYHDCNDGVQPCQRKVVWHVPPQYHHDGIVKEYFDVGTVNMEIVFRHEERDCRH